MKTRAGIFLATAYFLLLGVATLPLVAEASLLSFLGLGTNARAEEAGPTHNSQTIPLSEAHVGLSKELTLAAVSDSATVLSTNDGMAIVSETGPLGTISDVEDMPVVGEMNIYTVRSGDTVPAIAKMFGVSEDTIYYANDITRGAKLKVGETLLILPTTGLLHSVKKGDTLASIAKKYKVSIDDLILSNEVSKDSDLAIGDELIIPNGKIEAPKVAVKKPTSSSGGSINTSLPKVTDGYWGRPLAAGTWVRGRHGSFCRNGVDISDKLGTPVYAAGPGIVVMSKSNGAWNGGAGNVVMINHSDLGPNVRSIYAHLQRTNVSVGQTVAKGDVIGFLGSTGRSTGPHLHIEFCGTQNPLIANPRLGL